MAGRRSTASAKWLPAATSASLQDLLSSSGCGSAAEVGFTNSLLADWLAFYTVYGDLEGMARNSSKMLKQANTGERAAGEPF